MKVKTSFDTDLTPDKVKFKRPLGIDFQSRSERIHMVNMEDNSFVTSPAFEPIQVAMTSAVTNAAQAIDAYLLSFFGSEEGVKEFGKYYVLETNTPEIETTPEDGNAFKMSMHIEYRLRLKTKEELDAS